MSSDLSPALADSFSGSNPVLQDLDLFKSRIKSKALELGFSLCQFTNAVLDKLQTDTFTHWLEQGKAGDMTPWLERSKERRCDPNVVLPEVRSVIVLAMNYWQGTHPVEANALTNPNEGSIARYAWGDDYHKLIENKLKTLKEFIDSHSLRHSNHKAYVDTGPVLERSFAACAGLGWQGKSTMLINPKIGTWFFLAEIYSTIEFPIDKPLESPRCGSCTRCLDACPTKAIDPKNPYHLDATLCISYLTIEHKGSIPLALRPKIGNRIYGCDACLEACPWNRFAKESNEASFQARPYFKNTKLRDYLSLSVEDFRIVFKNSPMKRTKRRGLLRNVCVALGNVGTLDDLPALQNAAQHEEELIAEHARWAIEQIVSRENRP